METEKCDRRRLHSVVITDKFAGVYTAKENGNPILHVWPLDGIACHYDADEDIERIVGIELSGGYFEIVVEAINYAGMVRRNATDEEIRKATGCFSDHKNFTRDDFKNATIVRNLL